MSQTTLIAVFTLLSVTETTLTSPWLLSAATWPQPPQHPIPPIVFRFPNSVAAVPTVRSDLQGTITELLKDVRAPLTHVFLTGLEKSRSFGPSQCGEGGLK